MFLVPLTKNPRFFQNFKKENTLMDLNIGGL